MTTRPMTVEDYRELGIPVPEHMRDVPPRCVVSDVRSFYEGFCSPGASPVHRCEACGDEAESSPCCETCGLCPACCACEPQ